MPRYEVGPLDPAQHLGYVTVVLKLSADQQAALDRLLEEQQDRRSPNYHRWLTPEQFGDRFGASPYDYTAVVAWLESEGLHVENRARARNWVACSGSVRQMESTFRTRIRRYLIDGETHFGNATELSVPAALSHLVSGVRGLDDFWKKAERPDFLTAGGIYRIAPDDWATIYDVAPLYAMGIDGAGVRIAILGQQDLNLAYVDTFRRTFGLPATKVEMHPVGPDPGSAGNEPFLDVEWAGAVARGATLVFVYANRFIEAAQFAIDQNLAPIMSQSGNSCEPQTAVGNRVMAQQANAQGITWVVSSGDAGAASCDPHSSSGTTAASLGLAVNAPASFPEVTAVGGTELDYANGTYWGSDGMALSYMPEVVWNDTGTSGLNASGGGSSIYFPKPAWQSAPGMPNDNTRDLPDISFSAGGNAARYYVINANGGAAGVGGTSASAPAFAGVVALLNHYLMSQGILAQPGLGNINPGLYRLASLSTDVYHDITRGDNIVPCVTGSPDCVNGNLGFAAGPGYDLATGLGSADIYNLVTEWTTASSPTVTALTANPAAINLGDAVQLTAIVTPQSAAPGIPTGTVTFSTRGTILGTATLANLNGTASATLSVAGPLIAAGSTSVNATYNGDSAFDASTGTAGVGVTATSPGSAVVVSLTPNPAHLGQFVRVALTEVAGVGTKITGYTVNGTDNSALIVQQFGSNILPPYGGLWIGLRFNATSSAFPQTRVYAFSGVDADGRQWSQQATLTLMGANVPGIALTNAPAPVAGCSASQQLTLKERNGLNVQLTRFLVNGADWTSQIAQLFGATTLSASSSMQATVCWPDADPPASIAYEIDGVDQTGAPVRATLAAAFP